MARRLVCLVLAHCWIPAGAFAQPSAGPWTARVTCKSQLAEKYPLPATLPKDALLRDVPAGQLPRSEERAEIACGVFARPWKSQRTPSFVVFLETAMFAHHSGNTQELGERRLRMAVYRQGPDGQYRPAARSAVPFELQERKFYEVDLAPYKLTDEEFAFGVRTSGYVECEGNCNTETGDLQAFRVIGSWVHPILSTTLWSKTHTIGPANDDGSRDHEYSGDDDPAQLSVLKTRTKGFFDWRKKKGKVSAVLKWNGQKYELEGEDPVP